MNPDVWLLLWLSKTSGQALLGSGKRSDGWANSKRAFKHDWVAPSSTKRNTHRWNLLGVRCHHSKYVLEVATLCPSDQHPEKTFHSFLRRETPRRRILVWNKITWTSWVTSTSKGNVQERWEHHEDRIWNQGANCKLPMQVTPPHPRLSASRECVC